MKRQIDLTVSVFIDDDLILSETGIQEWAQRFHRALFEDNPGWTAAMQGFAYSQAPPIYVLHDPRIHAPAKAPRVPLHTFMKRAVDQYMAQAAD